MKAPLKFYSTWTLLSIASVCWIATTRRNLFADAFAFSTAPFSATRRNAYSRPLRMSDSDNDGDGVFVMVNGMPGPMATTAGEACLRKGLKLTPVAMTGPEIEPCTITVCDPVSGRSADVRLIPSPETEELESAIAGLKEACGSQNLLAIDYTHPSAVNANAAFYVANDLPFVMGTTGGDRDALSGTVAGHYCVIAPNMGKGIVALQTALHDLAAKYPAAFAGYKLSVRESHQKTKADTSGTAKAVIGSLKQLTGTNDDFTFDDIDMIRDDQEAMDFGVPENALNGHAFHTYTLTSEDGTVQFQLKHNVAGRTIYAEGTADAAKFLAKKMRAADPKKNYSMMDVLEEGALE